MSYVLRDYQQKASDAAVSFFNNKAKKTNAIMVLPTGSGKSLIIADIAARLDGHTLVFQPSKEILEQNFKKLCSYGILDCSIYSASFNSKEISRITFATIGSVKFGMKVAYLPLWTSSRTICTILPLRKSSLIWSSSFAQGIISMMGTSA